MQPDSAFAAAQDVTACVDPVIVTGAPRAGVRLLAAVLDGHPTLASGPDLPVMATLVQQWHHIEANLGVNHARHHGLPEVATRAAFRTAAHKLFLPRLRRTGKRRFVLQTFTAAVLLESFSLLFPKAQFVFVIRDPRDIARSLLSCDWRDVRTGRALPYTRDPIAAARFTVDVISQTLAPALTLHKAGRLLPLPYEELCCNPVAAASRLAHFLDEATFSPWVSAESATLVTLSPDNPHPTLRTGRLDSRQPAGQETPVDFGPMTSAIEQLRRTLGYRTTSS